MLGDSKERGSLDMRIAAIEAAQQLATRLGGMQYGVLLQNLVILEPYAREFPMQITMHVIEKLYHNRLHCVLMGGAKEAPGKKKVPQQIRELVSSFCFWDLDVESQVNKPSMPPDDPSFQVVVAQLLSRWSDAAENDEEDDDAFSKLMAKQRALERKASNESASALDGAEDGNDDGKKLASDVEAPVARAKLRNCNRFAKLLNYNQKYFKIPPAGLGEAADGRVPVRCADMPAQHREGHGCQKKPVPVGAGVPRHGGV